MADMFDPMAPGANNPLTDPNYLNAQILSTQQQALAQQQQGILQQQQTSAMFMAAPDPTIMARPQFSQVLAGAQSEMAYGMSNVVQGAMMGGNALMRQFSGAYAVGRSVATGAHYNDVYAGQGNFGLDTSLRRELPAVMGASSDTFWGRIALGGYRPDYMTEKDYSRSMGANLDSRFNASTATGFGIAAAATAASFIPGVGIIGGIGIGLAGESINQLVQAKEGLFTTREQTAQWQKDVTTRYGIGSKSMLTKDASYDLTHRFSEHDSPTYMARLFHGTEIGKSMGPDIKLGEIRDLMQKEGMFKHQESFDADSMERSVKSVAGDIKSLAGLAKVTREEIVKIKAELQKAGGYSNTSETLSELTKKIATTSATTGMNIHELTGMASQMGTMARQQGIGPTQVMSGLSDQISNMVAMQASGMINKDYTPTQLGQMAAQQQMNTMVQMKNNPLYMAAAYAPPGATPNQSFRGGMNQFVNQLGTGMTAMDNLVFYKQNMLNKDPSQIEGTVWKQYVNELHGTGMNKSAAEIHAAELMLGDQASPENIDIFLKKQLFGGEKGLNQMAKVQNLNQSLQNGTLVEDLMNKGMSRDAAITAERRLQEAGAVSMNAEQLADLGTKYTTTTREYKGMQKRIDRWGQIGMDGEKLAGTGQKLRAFKLQSEIDNPETTGAEAAPNIMNLFGGAADFSVKGIAKHLSISEGQARRYKEILDPSKAEESKWAPVKTAHDNYLWNVEHGMDPEAARSNATRELIENKDYKGNAKDDLTDYFVASDDGTHGERTRKVIDIIDTKDIDSTGATAQNKSITRLLGGTNNITEALNEKWTNRLSASESSHVNYAIGKQVNTILGNDKLSKEDQMKEIRNLVKNTKGILYGKDYSKIDSVGTTEEQYVEFNKDLGKILQGVRAEGGGSALEQIDRNMTSEATKDKDSSLFGISDRIKFIAGREAGGKTMDSAQFETTTSGLYKNEKARREFMADVFRKTTDKDKDGNRLWDQTGKGLTDMVIKTALERNMLNEDYIPKSEEGRASLVNTLLKNTGDGEAAKIADLARYTKATDAINSRVKEYSNVDLSREKITEISKAMTNVKRGESLDADSTKVLSSTEGRAYLGAALQSQNSKITKEEVGKRVDALFSGTEESKKHAWDMIGDATKNPNWNGQAMAELADKIGFANDGKGSAEAVNRLNEILNKIYTNMGGDVGGGTGETGGSSGGSSTPEGGKGPVGKKGESLMKKPEKTTSTKT